ncbi:MAG: flavodoxin domain-containing protein [Bacillota bacterium]
MLREKLNGNVDLYNLKEKKQPILANYDQIIIGGSIYIGKIQKEVSRFCTDHMAQLKGKRLGLYVCGMFF